MARYTPGEKTREKTRDKAGEKAGETAGKWFEERDREKKKLQPSWLFGPAVLAGCFLFLPFLALFSRVHWGEIFALWGQPASQAAIRLSLLTSGLATGLCLLLGVPLALLLADNNDRIWGKILQVIISLPMVLPPVVAGLILLITWGRKGLLGQYLSCFGIEIGFTTLAVVLAQTFVSLPFFVTSLVGSIQARGRQYEQTASKLGATPTQILVKITFPLLFPALLGATCLAFARAIGEFGATLTFAGSLQGVTRTLPLEIYLQRENDTESALALSFLLLTIALLLLVASQVLLQIRIPRWTGKLFSPVLPTEPSPEITLDWGQQRKDDEPILVKAQVVQRGIDFKLELAGGKITAVIGPNGAGKSTLIELLAGTLPSKTTQIKWGKQTVAPRRVLLEQKPRLFPHLTVLDNVAFPLRCHRMPKIVAYKIATSRLKLLGVEQIADRYPEQISGGQAQRVAVARALTLNPDILLLDEPFAGIDLEHTEQIRQILRQLPKTTIILVTHDLTDVIELAQELVVLNSGQVLTHGPVAVVLAQLNEQPGQGNQFLQQLLERAWLQRLEKLG